MYLKIKNIVVDYTKQRKHETVKQVKLYVNWIVKHLGSIVLCMSYGWYCVLCFLENPKVKYLKQM